MESLEKTAVKKQVENQPEEKVDPVVHFEMPADDRNRMSQFYSEAFGWKTQMLGEDMGNYVLATTTDDVDKGGKPIKPGIINGGFYPKDDKMPAQYPSVVIAVDDIKKSMEKVRKAGGEIIGEPLDDWTR